MNKREARKAKETIDAFVAGTAPQPVAAVTAADCDINKDGQVDTDDLLLLLGHWGPVNPTPPATNYGQFINIPSTYKIGNGSNLVFEQGPDFPTGGSVVFNTFIASTNSVSANVVDLNPPHTYSTSALDLIPAGNNEVRANIRNSSAVQVGVVKLPLTFETNVTPPPPSGNQTPSGPINLGNGAQTITNKSITNNSSTDNDGAGIMIDNAHHVTTLTITNVKVRSVNYALYCGAVDKAILNGCDFETGNGGNNYVVRGVLGHWTSSNCRFINNGGKAVFRGYWMTGTSNSNWSTSTNDIFSGDRMLLGGGADVEQNDPGPFAFFRFKGSKINCSTIEIYGLTHDITFENIDFAGTGHISIMLGAFNIKFIGCQNIPEIRRYGNNGLIGTGPDPSRGITVS